MPTPAWPITVTRCERSSRTTLSNSEPSSSDSSSRPISGVEARVRLVPATAMRTASQAATGSDLPFSRSGSSSTYSIDERVRRWVISPTVTEAGRAADCRREATFTGSPITVYPSPTWPASTSPELIPTRSANSTPSIRSLISAIAACIARPARTARSGSSSCATGAPKTAITLSPMNLSTVPPKRVTSSPRRRSARSTIDLTASGSIRSATAV